MVRLPQHYVLNYFYDNDGGCALTVLVNNERFHIIVDPTELKDRSKRGRNIRQEYQRLLHQIQTEASGEEPTHQTAPLFVQEDEYEAGDDSDDKDSGVDVGSPSADDNTSDDDNEHVAGPSEALQRWILTPLASTLTSNASKQQLTRKRTVQDWYHCPTYYYRLEISSGKLCAVKDEASASLTKRVDQLTPTINLPKYIQKLKVPSYAASELTVLVEAEGPAELPVHPTLVEHEGQRYFLKAVDNAQPGPTKREIQVMKKIEAEGLQHDIRVPLLRGLVHFDADSSSSKMMGFLMDAIDEPTPLTKMLDSEVPEEKRNRWAEESARMVDLLHQHNIIWGDAKGDNFMVDKNEELWIIDFGGSYTEGWVDPELKDSEEGDNQGIRRLVNGLTDPEKNTIGDEDEEGSGAATEDIDVAQTQHGTEHPKSLKRKHPKSAEDEQTEARARAAKQQKKSEDEHGTGEVDDDESHIPFEEGNTVRAEDDEDVGMMADDDDDDDEARVCYCDGPESGSMLACDGTQCKKEWFHFECLGITEAPKSKKWYCDECLIVEEWKSLHFASDRQSASVGT